MNQKFDLHVQNRRKNKWSKKRLNQQNPLHGRFLCLNALLGRGMLTFERVGLVLMPRRSSYWISSEGRGKTIDKVDWGKDSLSPEGDWNWTGKEHGASSFYNMTMFSLSYSILLRSARIRKLRLSPLSSQKVTKGSREFPQHQTWKTTCEQKTL